MGMRKLLLIARQDIALRVGDPMALLLAVGAPLVIAALLQVAFGGVVLGEGIPETKVEVGIVNLDRGSGWGNFGEVFVRALIPDSNDCSPDGDTQANPLLCDLDDLAGEALHLDLFEAREIADEERARRAVEHEHLVAALIVPADFSERLTSDEDQTPAASVRVYVNGRESILGAAFSCVVESLTNAMSRGEVTLRTTVNALLQDPRTRTRLKGGELDQAIAETALEAALPRHDPIQIQRTDLEDETNRVILTHYLAAGIAILAVGFTALIVTATLFQEKAQWTLQRVTSTPTQPWVIMGGKALGTYTLGFMQMVVLVGSMAALEQVLGGSPSGGVGPTAESLSSNLGLLLLIMTGTAAATGLGVTITGLARTYGQAANYGRAALILMGLAGGVFFPVELFPHPFDLVSRVTFHYWAMAGYRQWAAGGGLTSILPHALVMTAMAVLFFALGGCLVRRRIGFW